MVRFRFTTTTTTTSGYDEGYYGNESLVDKVLPEMWSMVDPYWYQFPPMNPVWHKLLGVFMIVVGVLSFCGNGLVVYIFTTTKNLRTPSNLLVVNLAFSDFCMMLCMSPAMVYNCFQETWVLGPFACELYAMTGSLFGNTSIWTMVIIALDRYNVIVKYNCSVNNWRTDDVFLGNFNNYSRRGGQRRKIHSDAPILSQVVLQNCIMWMSFADDIEREQGLAAKPLTVKTAVHRIIFIWLHGLLWTLFPMWGWNRYVPEGNMTACGTDYLTKSWRSRSYILAYSFFVYFSPLLIIIYAYYFIVKTVSEHEKNMRLQARKMNVSSLRSQADDAKTKNAEIKLAKVALMTITLWFVAWTPYLIINYAGIFELLTISPLFTIWGSVFAKANAVYNPIVYAISHPKYRVALKKRIPVLVCGKVTEGSDVVSTASVMTSSSTNV